MTTPPQDADWIRLGELIRVRMATRDLTAADIEQAGGPKVTKLREILNGRARTIRSSLKTNLEKAIDWSPGSVDQVLRGGHPIERLTAADLRRAPGPITAEQAANDEALDAAFADVERRRAESDARNGSNARVLRWLEIRRKPENERTPEERAFLEARATERNRLAELARRSAAEAPLIDLVVDGQELAEMKNDADVSRYVRQVEGVVVGFLGIDRLTDALDGREMERTIRRAVQGGVLEPLMSELDRLQAAGIEGRERLRRMSLAVDRLLLEQEEEERGSDDAAPPSPGTSEPDASAEANEDQEAFIVPLAARTVDDEEKPE